jgi:putative hydrolase of the HAD superfamily
LFEQEKKIERSPLRSYFKYVEIVGSKEPEMYRTIMGKFGIEPERFLMVGNSLRSDILPVLAAGGHAVYVPYEHTWAHENDVPQEELGSGYHEVGHIEQIPELLWEIANR